MSKKGTSPLPVGWRGLAVAMALAVPVIVYSTTTESSVTPHAPPSDLKWVEDHWTPWVPPELPDGAEVYVIEKGDTLWDLAEQDLNDPYLWPQIWDKNRYILDSHWIYPGDPLVMPGPVTVVGQEDLPPDVDAEDGEGGDGEGTGEELITENTFDTDENGEPVEVALTPAPDPTGRPTGQGVWRKLYPDDVADPADMLCSGYILPDRWESDMYFYSSEEERQYGHGTGSVLYANKGLSDGVRPGDKFYVVHQEKTVKHPVSGRKVGYHVRRMAVAQVIVSQAETSTLELVDGCDSVHLGYDLIPFEEMVSPKKRDIELERYGVEDNGNTAGYLIWSEGPRMALGTGHIVFIDLGTADGVDKGDYFMVYREDVTERDPNEAHIKHLRYKHKSKVEALNVRMLPRGKAIPRKMLGQLAVIAVHENTSVAKVTYAWREMYPGDEVQLLD